MELSLIHAGLAAGMALAALPVILHLFMRQTPKHVIFPALRLVRERQKRSRKRMRIKNWLLLLARMALLALMALALARPRLYSQVPLGDESVPTALGLVFDTSLSMGYKEKDKTRLDEAKERVQAILDKLPDSSLVFVVDSSQPGAPVGLTPAAARKRIADLTIRAVNRPLNAAMGQVYPAVVECDRPFHEVYVLTDLSRSSWNPDQPAEGLDRVEKARQTPSTKIATFVLRIGSHEVEDVAIDQAEPAASVATQGEPIEIKGRVRNLGSKPVSRVVEFYLDGVKKDQKLVELVANGGQAEVSFLTPARLPEGELHRGELRLGGAPDPLEFNDRRYFTFKVRPALQVLLISDVALDAEYVAAALDPDPSPSSSRSIELKRVRPADFLAEYRDTLKNFAAVFLLNAQALDEESWGLLNGYVHEGGGLIVGLGDRCRAADYNGPIAGQLLPAQLEQASNLGETTFGRIADVTHPLFARYPKELASQLAQVPVYRYWTIKLPEGNISRVLLSYADQTPALIERSFKGPRTGRVLLWTTPLARRPRRTDRAAWNEFPLPAANNWSFLALMNESVRYVAGAASERFDFEAGEDVSLTLPPGTRAQTFLLTGPDAKNTQSLSPSASSDTLQVIAPQLLGQWTVTPRDAADRQLRLGFSLNPPGTESQFTPLLPADLDRLFGKDGYALAEDAKTLQEKATEAKVGRELFPYMMMLILLVVTLENFLANTFYKDAPRPAPAGATARLSST
jgi:hypothetical protein